MSLVTDNAARARALTDLAASLLVEAAAGTGKTSLLAGRLALLLATGSDPRQVAAITFTELAAADLGGRRPPTIHRPFLPQDPPTLPPPPPPPLSPTPPPHPLP